MTNRPFAPIADSLLGSCLSAVETDRKAGTGSARLCCSPDFPGFDGHFPGEPVLPAVVQLMAVRLVAETVLGLPLAPAGVDRLKFKGMVRPDDAIDVAVSLSDQGGLVRGGFSLKRSGGTIASGAILFLPRQGEA